MSSGGSATKGNTTPNQNVERLQHIKRMSCKGVAMRGKATTSRRVERRQGVETMSGAVRQEVTQQPARAKERQMGVGGGGGVLRGSNMLRG